MDPSISYNSIVPAYNCQNHIIFNYSLNQIAHDWTRVETLSNQEIIDLYKGTKNAINTNAEIYAVMEKTFENISPQQIETISKWISTHTATWNPDKFKGAYPIFNRLAKNMQLQGIESSAIQAIDAEAKKYIASIKELQLPNEVKSFLVLEDLKLGGHFRNTSWDFYDITKYEVINLLKTGEIDLEMMGIKSISDLSQYLGDECKNVTNLVIPDSFLILSDYNRRLRLDSDKIAIRFSNLESLSIKPTGKCTSIKTLILDDCKWKCHLSFCESYPDLEKIELCWTQNIDITDLKKCQNLIRANFYGAKQIIGWENLAESSIVDLGISASNQIKDYSFLLSMDRLRCLTLGMNTFYESDLDFNFFPDDIAMVLKNKGMALMKHFYRRIN